MKLRYPSMETRPPRRIHSDVSTQPGNPPGMNTRPDNRSPLKDTSQGGGTNVDPAIGVGWVGQKLHCPTFGLSQNGQCTKCNEDCAPKPAQSSTQFYITCVHHYCSEYFPDFALCTLSPLFRWHSLQLWSLHVALTLLRWKLTKCEQCS